MPRVTDELTQAQRATVAAALAERLGSQGEVDWGRVHPETVRKHPRTVRDGAGAVRGPRGSGWRGGGPLIPGGLRYGILAEMLRYAPDPRAMTGERGDYSMEFDHYAQVPAHLAEKAAAAAA